MVAIDEIHEILFENLASSIALPIRTCFSFRCEHRRSSSFCIKLFINSHFILYRTITIMKARAFAFLSPTPIGGVSIFPSPNLLSELSGTTRTSSPRRRCARIAPVKCIADKEAVVSLISDTVVRLPSQTGRIDVPLRVDSLGGRLRRISCGVEIEQPAARVWDVLTSYEKNADYIPNIISVDVRYEGGDKLLDQVGILSNKLRIRSRIVMKISEDRPNWCVAFTLQQGRDFVRFDGTYQLTETTPKKSCRISYEIVVQPIAFYPVSLVERKIAKEVPNMLAAIREEATFANHVPFQ